MKNVRFFRVPLVLVLCAALSFGCGDDEGINPEINENLENSIQFGGVRTNVGSVLYILPEDNDGEFYSVYVSPTLGIRDLDVMLMADDYIHFTVSHLTGEVNLLSEGNSLLYNDLQISAGNSANVSSVDLEITLTSSRTIRINLDAQMTSGDALKLNYHGICHRYPEDETTSYDVVLTDVIYAYYLGKGSTTYDTYNYYLALTDGTFEMSSSTYTMTSGGTVLVLDLFALLGDSWRDMPTGTFTSSEYYEDHTYGLNYSGVRVYASGATKSTTYALTGPVTVEKEADGTFTITASYLNDSNVEQTMIYQGDLSLTNSSSTYSLPQYDGDMYIDGYTAYAIYDGNLFDNGSGVMEIQIRDELYDTVDGGGGFSVTLYIFGKLFAESEITIGEGHYEAATTYTSGTWMPCAELSYFGLVIPLGTYGHYDDGSDYGQLSYAATGTIDIEKTDNEYHIVFDMLNGWGDKIQGEYTGEISITDSSDDDTDDDGTSTLEEDYEMDLSYISTAILYNPDQIYVGGIGYSDFTDYNPAAPYCLQDIRFGTEMLPELPPEGVEPQAGDSYDGDIFRLQILGDPDYPKRIVPGTYYVTEERWPAYFKPGVCVRGILLTDGFMGTSWVHLTKSYHNSTDEDGNPIVKTYGGVMDGHACIYGGYVIISKPENVDENVFTIEFSGIDVRQHTVSGIWTGAIEGATYTEGVTY